MEKLKAIIAKWMPSFVIDPILVYRRYIAANRLSLSLKSVSQEINYDRIRNAKILSGRLMLLELMPKDAVVAEVGVADGGFSQQILSRCKPSKLHLIDLWTDESDNPSYNDQAFRKVSTHFQEQLKTGAVEMHRALSWDALESFPDHHFDWVYIDACHTYESVRKDLLAAMRKVKPDGFICGHDYVRWGDALSRMGVVEAVNEFCNQYEYDLVYLTNESNRKISYALQKSYEQSS